MMMIDRLVSVTAYGHGGGGHGGHSSGETLIPLALIPLVLIYGWRGEVEVVVTREGLIPECAPGSPDLASSIVSLVVPLQGRCLDHMPDIWSSGTCLCRRFASWLFGGPRILCCLCCGQPHLNTPWFGPRAQAPILW